MPQYLVTAQDGTDSEAIARRMAARPAHMENIAPMVADGRLKAGGALLDDDGHMIGSVVIADFATRVDLDHWLATDPYITGGVWKTIDVKPFRLAVLAKSM